MGAHPLPNIRWEERGWEEGDIVWAWSERHDERGFLVESGWVRGTVEGVRVGRVMLRNELLLDIRVHDDAQLLENVMSPPPGLKARLIRSRLVS